MTDDNPICARCGCGGSEGRPVGIWESSDGSGRLIPLHTRCALGGISPDPADWDPDDWVEDLRPPNRQSSQR
jgi:hypothetical protein